ncbi:MAG: GNAT family N-acetyltransferase [Patescibacteria group bacterium]|nr:GNAT family N-acetyltransferase [Patescibacteria group bacterium]
MDFQFTTEWPLSMADQIVYYLLRPRLWIPERDYPDFGEWTCRVHGDLKSQRKRALLALVRGDIVGAIVYQRHAVERHAIEIKNISVRPDHAGRYVASFLLRNAEIEGRRDFAGVTDVMVDAKRSNRAIAAFLNRQGYRVASVLDLYGLGAGDDVVFRKPLPARGLILRP